MAELDSFLGACGHPERSFRAVHVTGTSGKGSVAAILAEALRLAGHRVGLHVSPFLQSPAEKVWIDGRYVSAHELADLVDWIWPIALPRRRPETPASVHGMASVAVAFEAFRRAGVEVAVVEAGCGGRFDLTNVLDAAVTVITTVGLDHTASLGPGLAEIAWHKAGIMRRGVPAVTGATGEALDVIRREAEAVAAPLTVVEPGPGPFWQANAAVARAAAAALPAEARIPDEALDAAVSSACLPGRREAVPEPGRRVVLDGAHNPDKMAALVATLEPGCVMVLGCLGSKDLSGITAAACRVSSRVVATAPTVYGKPAVRPAEVAAACRRAGLEAAVEADPDAALELAFDLAGPETEVVVTGSLYLVGQLRDRWYPTDEVVLQQTSWPRLASSC
jgi:dihydrofolate synthase/folylpolyglutamate synthase